jgi:hypothetical protein
MKISNISLQHFHISQRFYIKTSFNSKQHSFMNYAKSVWTSIFILLGGIVLLFMQGTAINVFVRAVGILFVAAAALNFCIQQYSSRRATAVASAADSETPQAQPTTSRSVLNTLTTVASVALGVWMIIDSEGLTNMLVYIFAALITISGVYQILALAIGYRPLKFPLAFYVLPTILALTGIILYLIGADAVKNAMVLITGIAMIVFAVSSLLAISGARSFERNTTTATTASSSDEPTVQDVTPTE